MCVCDVHNHNQTLTQFPGKRRISDLQVLLLEKSADFKNNTICCVSCPIGQTNDLLSMGSGQQDVMSQSSRRMKKIFFQQVMLRWRGLQQLSQRPSGQLSEWETFGNYYTLEVTKYNNLDVRNQNVDLVIRPNDWRKGITVTINVDGYMPLLNWAIVLE